MRRSRWGIVAAMCAMTFSLAVAPQAYAANINAITNVEITQPSEVRQGSRILVKADWALDASARSGDVFSLTFPTSPSVTGVAANFNLLAPDGQTVGTCNVTLGSIVCTLSSYVDTHSNISGDLFFWAVAAEESTDSSLSFDGGNGVIFDVPIPGGNIGPVQGANVWPTKPFKNGRVKSDGNIEWSIYITGDQLLSDPNDPVVITDQYDPALSAPAIIDDIYWVTQPQWTGPDPFNYNQFLYTPGDFTYIPNTGPNEFQLSINRASIDPAHLYQIAYTSTPVAPLQQGQVIQNSALGLAWSASSSFENWGAGGSGGGVTPRTISLTKEISGTEVTPGYNYAFAISCEDQAGTPVPNFPKTGTVQAGQTVDFTDIPVNSICELTETDMGGASQLSTNTVNPVTVSAATPAVISFIATNTFGPVPPATGDIHILKDVIGSGAELAAGQSFEIDYRYVDADGVTVAGSMVVEAGGVLRVLAGIPEGTVVHLSERTPTAVEGAVWGEPQFVVDGQLVGSEADITVNGVIELVITNTITTTPTPTPTPTQEVSPTDGGDVPTSPGAGSDDGLAVTGLDALGILSVGILLAVAGVFIVRARRQASA